MSCTSGNVKKEDSDHEFRKIRGHLPDLKVCEVALILRTSEEVVRTLISRGDIRAYRMNPNSQRNNYRVPVIALDEFRKSREVIPA